jgi:hypothetical protein
VPEPVAAATPAPGAEHANPLWPWESHVDEGEDEPEPIGEGDPFAGMPRIRPFTDFSLDRPAAPVLGKHSAPAEQAWRVRNREDRPSPGGRRRRESDEDDTLARILQRERGED